MISKYHVVIVTFLIELHLNYIRDADFYSYYYRLNIYVTYANALNLDIILYAVVNICTHITLLYTL